MGDYEIRVERGLLEDRLVARQVGPGVEGLLAFLGLLCLAVQWVATTIASIAPLAFLIAGVAISVSSGLLILRDLASGHPRLRIIIFYQVAFFVAVGAIVGRTLGMNGEVVVLAGLTLAMLSAGIGFGYGLGTRPRPSFRAVALLGLFFALWTWYLAGAIPRYYSPGNLQRDIATTIGLPVLVVMLYGGAVLAFIAARRAPPPQDVQPDAVGDQWECDVCTESNGSWAGTCTACGTPRPGQVPISPAVASPVPTAPTSGNRGRLPISVAQYQAALRRVGYEATAGHDKYAAAEKVVLADGERLVAAVTGLTDEERGSHDAVMFLTDRRVVIEGVDTRHTSECRLETVTGVDHRHRGWLVGTEITVQFGGGRLLIEAVKKEVAPTMVDLIMGGSQDAIARISRRSAAPSQGEPSLSAELEKLADLLERGLIDRTQFEAAKNKLLR